MRRAGPLDEIDPAVWNEAFITDSRAVGDGDSTLREFARSVFRVAILNARTVSVDRGRVRFRWKKSGSRRWRTMELDALELLRRFLQHVLPAGFQKVRQTDSSARRARSRSTSCDNSLRPRRAR